MNAFEVAIEHAAPYLERYGYFAVFAAIAMEGLGVPAPGVTILVAASIAAGQGVMSLPTVIVTALAAALIGFNGAYWLGYAAGRGLLQRLPFFNHHHFQRLHRMFGRWGTLVVVIAPFLDGLRQVNGYAAGLAEMPWHRYALGNLFGTVLWVGLWSVLSFEASRHASSLYRALHVGHFAWYVAAAVVFVGMLAYLFWWRHRREHRDEADA